MSDKLVIKTNQKAEAWKSYFKNELEGVCGNCYGNFPIKIPQDVKKMIRLHKTIKNPEIPDAIFVPMYPITSNMTSGEIRKMLIPICYYCSKYINNNNISDSTFPMDVSVNIDIDDDPASVKMIMTQYIQTYLTENYKCIYKNNEKYCMKHNSVGTILCEEHHNYHTHMLQKSSHLN